MAAGVPAHMPDCIPRFPRPHRYRCQSPGPRQRPDPSKVPAFWRGLDPSDPQFLEVHRRGSHSKGQATASSHALHSTQTAPQGRSTAHPVCVLAVLSAAAAAQQMRPDLHLVWITVEGICLAAWW